VTGRTLVSLTAEGPASALETWLPDRDSVAYLSGVYPTDTRHGPVNVLAWWDRDSER